MRQIFLLGAGASIEAGIPGAYLMTNKILELISNDAKLETTNRILRFTVGGLLFQRGIRGENPFGGINIEDLFNAVILLGERQTSELGPFIGSWHPQLTEIEGGKVSLPTVNKMLDSISEDVLAKMGEGLKPSQKQKNLLNSHSKHWDFSFSNIIGSASSREFQQQFSTAVRQVEAGTEGKSFISTADQMIGKLIDMVWLQSSDKVKYLQPLIAYSKKTGSVIVTLNYDNAIELAAEKAGIGIDTGFDAWSKTGDFAFEPKTIPLIKLHGSIDWSLKDGLMSKKKPLPYQEITRVYLKDPEQARTRPTIVFGGKNKLTAKGPFLSLLRAFEKQLLEVNQLTTIGYSFRDEHVNEFIANWINGSSRRKITIIDPSFPQSNSEFAKRLRRIEDKRRVQIISKKASNGIKQITKAVSKK